MEGWGQTKIIFLFIISEPSPQPLSLRYFPPWLSLILTRMHDLEDVHIPSTSTLPLISPIISLSNLLIRSFSPLPFSCLALLEPRPRFQNLGHFWEKKKYDVQIDISFLSSKCLNRMISGHFKSFCASQLHLTHNFILVFVQI